MKKILLRQISNEDIHENRMKNGHFTATTTIITK